MKKKTKRRLKIVIILFIAIIEFFRYLPKDFTNIISIHDNEPIIVSKSDIDKDHHFHFFMMI